MKTVPLVCIGNNSHAEERIFKLLREVRFSPADTALHSLNIGAHESKVWGEADFFICCEKGVLLLEIKGGGVACRDGVWEFTNSRGETSLRYEGPGPQAKKAFYSLKNNYIDACLPKLTSRHAFGWGCVFPDIDAIGGDAMPMPELPAGICAFKADCVGPQAFKAWLERLFDWWTEKFEGSGRGRPAPIAKDDIGKLVSLLRPSFEMVPSLDTQLASASRRLCRLTEEQYQGFDEINENDRILVLGGAGTGKTFLAIANARYESAQGKRVTYTTRNEFLARFVAAQNIGDGFQSVPFDTLDGVSPDSCDVLIVDEGQDLCQFAALDKLNAHLAGGLESGRWRWFGDPNWQVSPHYEYDRDAFEYLRPLGFMRRLKRNIRNAPPIVEAIVDHVDADLGDPGAQGVGPRFKIVNIGSESERIAALSKVLQGWADGGAQRHEVAVLLADGEDCAGLAKTLSASGHRTEPLSTKMFGPAPRNAIIVTTVEGFKGLERPLVCIAGLGQGDDNSLLRKNVYLGFSRANHTLAMICNPGEVDAMNKLRRSKRA